MYASLLLVFVCSLNECLNIPLEGADAEHGVVVVGLLETAKQDGCLFVLDDGENGTIHCRPSMAAEVRVTGLGATTADLFEEGVTADVRTAQYGEHIFFLCLVKGYKDCFHMLILFLQQSAILLVNVPSSRH